MLLIGEKLKPVAENLIGVPRVNVKSTSYPDVAHLNLTKAQHNTFEAATLNSCRDIVRTNLEPQPPIRLSKAITIKSVISMHLLSHKI